MALKSMKYAAPDETMDVMRLVRGATDWQDWFVKSWVMPTDERPAGTLEPDELTEDFFKKAPQTVKDSARDFFGCETLQRQAAKFTDVPPITCQPPAAEPCDTTDKRPAEGSKKGCPISDADRDVDGWLGGGEQAEATAPAQAATAEEALELFSGYTDWQKWVTADWRTTGETKDTLDAGELTAEFFKSAPPELLKKAIAHFNSTQRRTFTVDDKFVIGHTELIISLRENDGGLERWLNPGWHDGAIYIGAGSFKDEFFQQAPLELVEKVVVYYGNENEDLAPRLFANASRFKDHPVISQYIPITTCELPEKIKFPEYVHQLSGDGAQTKLRTLVHDNPKKKVVLFFYSRYCPHCVHAKPKVIEAMEKLHDELGDNVIIVAAETPFRTANRRDDLIRNAEYLSGAVESGQVPRGMHTSVCQQAAEMADPQQVFDPFTRTRLWVRKGDEGIMQNRVIAFTEYGAEGLPTIFILDKAEGGTKGGSRTKTAVSAHDPEEILRGAGVSQ